MNVIETIEYHLKASLADSAHLAISDLHKVQLTLNVDKQKQAFGDLSCNGALILAKELNANPRDVAQKIISTFNHSYISKMEVAGPGFINIFLSQQALHALAQELYTEGAVFFKDTLSKKESYCIEFVSANPTGPLHLGHGRGGIIGDVLTSILSFLGHTVAKEYYINDAGNQIEKLGKSFKIRCLQAAGKEAELPEDGYQGEYLSSLAQDCYSTFGDELLIKDDSFFGTYAKEHLLEKIRQTLSDYGITFDTWFSETSLHTSGAIAEALEQLTAQGHIFSEDGTEWLKTTAFGDDKDRVVRKKTGELTYIAADIGYMQDKIARGFDHLICILGQDHHSYLTRLKAVIEALGYDPNRLDIILYQLVTIKEDGLQLKLSKRAGRIVGLDDIIKTVGKDVARFFYLHKKADAHLDFDLALALKHTDENPLYYIQYAYVRIRSITEKAYQYEQFQEISQQDIASLGNSEALLIKKIASLKELLSSIEKNYQTHLLTYYTIELAQMFHTYYSHHKVIDLENVQQSRGRLLLCQLVEHTLKTCFDLLGIEAPQRM